MLPLTDEPSADRLDLLLRVAATLAARADGRPLMVAVDDAQWLDDVSAALVQQIATSGTGFVLVAVRSGTPVPEPVTELWKDDLARRVDVQALSLPDIEELVAVGLSGPCDRATAHELARVSGGNVLFLRELVIGELELDALVEDRGVWRLRGPLAVTASLVELVEARMGRLDPDERALLEVVTLSGGLEAAVLDNLGPSGLLEVLERKGLVDVVREDRRLLVRVAHPLYGEVVQRGMPELRARAIRRQLADTIERAGGLRRDDALRVATWRLDAGGDMSAAAWNKAAEIALTRFDSRLAERLARASIAAGGGHPASYTLGFALFGQGRGDEAETVLEPIEANVTNDADRARLALIRAENLLFVQGRASDAESVLHRALTAVSDPRWRDELTSASGASWSIHRAGDPGVTGEPARPPPTLGEHDDAHGTRRGADREVTKRTLIGNALSWAAEGHTDRALASIGRWLERPTAWITSLIRPRGSCRCASRTGPSCGPPGATTMPRPWRASTTNGCSRTGSGRIDSVALPPRRGAGLARRRPRRSRPRPRRRRGGGRDVWVKRPAAL